MYGMHMNLSLINMLACVHLCSYTCKSKRWGIAKLLKTAQEGIIYFKVIVINEISGSFHIIIKLCYLVAQ